MKFKVITSRFVVSVPLVVESLGLNRVYDRFHGKSILESSNDQILARIGVTKMTVGSPDVMSGRRVNPRATSMEC